MMNTSTPREEVYSSEKRGRSRTRSPYKNFLVPRSRSLQSYKIHRRDEPSLGSHIRLRDLTPSRSASSAIVSRPAKIIESDEMNVSFNHAFPVFSNDASLVSTSTSSMTVDESAADEIPFPIKPIKSQKIDTAIEKDFEREFKRDTSSVLEQPVRSRSKNARTTRHPKIFDIEDRGYIPKVEMLHGSSINGCPAVSVTSSNSIDTEIYQLQELKSQQELSRDRGDTNIVCSSKNKVDRNSQHTNPKMSDPTESYCSVDLEGSNSFETNSMTGNERKSRWHKLKDYVGNKVTTSLSPTFSTKSPMEEAKNIVSRHLLASGRTGKDDENDVVGPYDSDFDDEIFWTSDDELYASNDSFANGKKKGKRVRVGIASHLMQLHEPSNDLREVDGIYHESHSDSNLGPINSSKQSLLDKITLKRSSQSFTNLGTKIFPKPRQSDFNMPSFKRNVDEKYANRKKNRLRGRFKVSKEPVSTARITVHIADIIQRQKFILTLCKAFMGYGAPNHRLEEYMRRTAQVLEIDASFVYFPGVIIVSFGDPSTKISEIRVIRVSQGFDLSKLDDAQDIYKAVVHDRLGVEEAIHKLDDLLTCRPIFNNFWMIIFYGLASAFIIIWFNGSWLDMIPSFAMGCIVGFFQLVIAPKSTLYSSVFEVASSILLSFLGRAIGSIYGGRLFCFSAIVQSGLAMILPGYTILSGALEIQSRSIVSGTVRMFYAIVYSLFLGFGITLGSALYGWIDSNAVTSTTCSADALPPLWNLLFIPAFTVFATLGVEARWSQLPIMVIIASAGYAVYYFSARHFSISQFNAALGAFVVGLLSNLYSRFGMPFRKLGYCGSAFTAMYPGIIDLVPGSVASRNVLAAGITQLNSAGSATESSGNDLIGDSTLTFGITMIEVSIGISVGLFLSAIIVYPFGKKKTGIFTL